MHSYWISFQLNTWSAALSGNLTSISKVNSAIVPGGRVTGPALSTPPNALQAAQIGQNIDDGEEESLYYPLFLYFIFIFNPFNRQLCNSRSENLFSPASTCSHSPHCRPRIVTAILH